ncbi:MAG: hypothetical protein LBV79_09145 [Candidatus Adiutrix sp.]|jgi:hypothetical protein|nr:hypothetical protein [Candidatus Adiutrix sp.]
MKKFVFLCMMIGAALFLAPGGQAGAQGEPDFVAVAFTGKNYTGVSWKIPSVGRYDLWERFALPNDSICSIRVRPGYQVGIYEHSEFGGERETITEDSPDLGKFARWASSLEAEQNADNAPGGPEWQQNAAEAGAFQKAAKGGQANKDAIQAYSEMEEPDWYGGRSDAYRVMTGGHLLDLFAELGYDVSEWQPNSFAQQMNNFFDWRKDKSVWEIACMILNVDPAEKKSAAAEQGR